MKKHILFYWLQVAFVGLPFSAVTQSLTLKGEVRDAKTNTPLPYVSIFVSNTTRGALADSTGQFTITGLSAGTYTVVASMVGFRSAFKELTLQVGGALPVLSFSLVEQEKGLDEVTIKAKRDKQWEKDLKLFSDIFLGTDENARSCQILNAYLIDINRSEGKLWASASAPLLIENRRLGYKLTFVLKQFEVSPNNYTIGGDTFFEELSGTAAEREKWRANRLDAYRGSLGHFLQAMCRQSVEKEGFAVYTHSHHHEDKPSGSFSYLLNVENSVSKAQSASLVSKIGDLMVLDASRTIEIHFTPKTEKLLNLYGDVSHQVSRIESQKKSLAFNQDGLFLDKYAVRTEGSFNNYRIASMLPTDYHPAIEELLASSKKSFDVFNTYQEKIYLHTSKPHYKLGETIWFKAYQVYQNPIYRDAISRTLYVDLISPERKILDTKVLYSTNGMAWGDFTLADTLKDGLYHLRSYTNWMRNYGDTLQTLVAIPILRAEQMVANTPPTYESGGFDVEMAQGVVRSDSLVRFSIRGLPAQSYSVSVTSETQIGTYPAFRPVSFGNAYLDTDKITYPAERGLRYVGRVLDATNRPVVGNLVITRPDTIMYEQVQTNKMGEFELAELQAKDTLVLSVIATTSKGKPIPSIALDLPKPMPIVNTLPPTAPLVVMPNSTVARSDRDLDKLKTIELLTVDIKAKKRRDTTQIQRFHKTFGVPSYGFTANQLNFEGKTHFMQALQNRIPGLEIFFDYATGQIFLRSLRHGRMQPVIWLDGMPYDDINDLAFLTGAMIARIDVYRLNSAMFAQPGKTGLIAIYTKTFLGGDEQRLINTPPAPGVKRFVLKGFHQARAFYVPTLSQDQSRRSQVANRTTLYWNPHLQTDNSGRATVQFEAIAAPGRYRVEVVGYDFNGNPTRTDTFFEVKR